MTLVIVVRIYGALTTSQMLSIQGPGEADSPTGVSGAKAVDRHGKEGWGRGALRGRPVCFPPLGRGGRG